MRSSIAGASASHRSRPAIASAEHNGPVGVITRIGNTPGVRRLVRRSPTPAEVRESPDDDDLTPAWCADCRREVLFGSARCPDCGGVALSAEELARRTGGLPPSNGVGPGAW